jgi:hypothetical protein
MPRITEFDVRPLDANGEVVDVDSYKTLAEAIRYAEHLATLHPAVVIERHRMDVSERGAIFAHIENDEYDTVWSTGSDAVLRLFNG